MPDGPLSRYRRKAESGGLIPDPAQERALERLQKLHHDLKSYHPPAPVKTGGWRGKLGFGKGKKHAAQERMMRPAVKGLYIFGDVGRGKSMIMDLFYEGLNHEQARRVHFHAFMREVQERLHRRRGEAGHGDTGRGKARKEQFDPLRMIALDLAGEIRVLCLDEMEIINIADAMIVGRLFTEITEQGVVVVTTSNRHPDDLYKDGLQREKFLPFIALIKERMKVIELVADRDYRLGRMKGMRVYETPLGPKAEDWLNRCFLRLAEGDQGQPDTIAVDGRSVCVPRAVGDKVAAFGFEDLCGQALGSHDYMEVAKRFDAVVLSDIPVLTPEIADKARRFVVLIDTLYEHRVALVCSAAVPPQDLYPTATFEFQRTVSRLMEMQSEDYVRQGHITD
ncbi:MAG: cell division protein ZapE [Rhodospirillaceae bacterium]